jgi:hypothetical protein
VTAQAGHHQDSSKKAKDEQTSLWQANSGGKQPSHLQSHNSREKATPLPQCEAPYIDSKFTKPLKSTFLEILTEQPVNKRQKYLQCKLLDRKDKEEQARRDAVATTQEPTRHLRMRPPQERPRRQCVQIKGRAHPSNDRPCLHNWLLGSQVPSQFKFQKASQAQIQPRMAQAPKMYPPQTEQAIIK